MNKIATLITAFAKPNCLRANFVSALRIPHSALIIALAMISCTQNEMLQDTSDSNLIGFGTYAGQSTKANSSYYVKNNTLIDGTSFGVMAYKHSDYWSGSDADFGTKFMEDVEVSVSGSGQTFDSSPKKYWPIKSKLSFLAYYPKNNADVTFNNNANTYPTIDFTVQAAAADQVDLMYAPLVANKTKDDNGGSVNLSFKHALTRLKFEAKRDGAESDNVAIKIKSVTVKDAASKGTFTFAETSDIWSGQGTTTDFPLANYTGTFLGTTPAPVTTAADDNTLLMIPQPNDDVKIEVKYTQDDRDSTATLALAGTEAWTANKSILYTLTIDPGTAVTFTATVGEWGKDTNIELTEPADITLNGNTYEIYTAKGLLAFGQLVNGSTANIPGLVKGPNVPGFSTTKDLDANAKLMDDISWWTDKYWVIIGGYDLSSYTGTFDGDGHLISNLKGRSFFCEIGSGGKVKNVGTHYNDDSNASCIADKNYGTVTACYNAGGTTGFGGVVRENYGTVTNCYNTSKGASQGGVVKDNYGIVTNCYNVGKVDYGGVVQDNYGTVINCYNAGNVIQGGVVYHNCSGTVVNSGGVEEENYGTVIACYNVGKVERGGVVHSNKKGCTVTACYNVSNIGYGGVVTNNDGTLTACYNVGKVEVGDAVVNFKGSGGSSKLIDCYYLALEGAKDSDATKMTEDEMKAAGFIDILNGSLSPAYWKADDIRINNGFPILTWQVAPPVIP